MKAAEHVCAGEGISEEILNILTSLCDRSLVVADEHEGATRYRLLETVRRHAQEWLHEQREEARWLGRHLAYFVMLAEEAEPSLRGAKDQQTWVRRIGAEHDNVRSALSRSSVSGGDAASGLRLSAAVRRFWWMCGCVREGRAWLDSMLAATGEDDALAVRAKALNGPECWRGFKVTFAPPATTTGTASRSAGRLATGEALRSR